MVSHSEPHRERDGSIDQLLNAVNGYSTSEPKYGRVVTFTDAARDDLMVVKTQLPVKLS